MPIQPVVYRLEDISYLWTKELWIISQYNIRDVYSDVFIFVLVGQSVSQIDINLEYQLLFVESMHLRVMFLLIFIIKRIKDTDSCMQDFPILPLCKGIFDILIRDTLPTNLPCRDIPELVHGTASLLSDFGGSNLLTKENP